MSLTPTEVHLCLWVTLSHKHEETSRSWYILRSKTEQSQEHSTHIFCTHMAMYNLYLLFIQPVHCGKLTELTMHLSVPYMKYYTLIYQQTTT